MKRPRSPCGDDEETPHSNSAAALAERERLRYRNYASEEAISEALLKLPEAARLDGGSQALRGLWVRGVDWGAKWQANQVRLTERKLEAACRELAHLRHELERLGARKGRGRPRGPAVEERGDPPSRQPTVSWDPRKEPE